MTMVVSKFEELSKRIWSDIQLANKFGINYGEETITDSILLDLAQENYPNIKVIQTQKPVEALQGTDWEWYVGSNKSGWVRFAIQAKKINLKKHSYNSLNHKVGLAPKQKNQIDILYEFAYNNGAVPLYCFYNYYPNVHKEKHWHCAMDFDKSLLGWTFTTLNNINKILQTRGSRNFDKVHCLEKSYPIRCLFSCLFPKYINSNYMEEVGNLKEVDNNIYDYFLDEPFKRVNRLPREILKATETGILNEFPNEYYSPEIKLYPKRIAVIEL